MVTVVVACAPKKYLCIEVHAQLYPRTLEVGNIVIYQGVDEEPKVVMLLPIVPLLGTLVVRFYFNINDSLV